MVDYFDSGNLDTFLEEYEELLFDVANRLYAARRDFLRDGYDGYAEDTVYSQTDERYKYWPVKEDGWWFVGYTSPCPGEEDVLNEFEQKTEFAYIGCGNARIVLEAPDPYEYAVKVGRCGTDLNFGDGRQHILSEWAYTQNYAGEAPILPCLHASSGGEFGVYPLIEADMAERPPEDESVIDHLREKYGEVVPEYDRDHISDNPDNFGWWDGEPIMIDYYHTPRNSPMGIPDHVDGEQVIEEVDRLRREGEKMDMDVEAEQMVEPEIDE